MTTGLSTGKVPVLYREVYDLCSVNDQHIHRDLFEKILAMCNLEKSALKTIWDLVGPAQGVITRTNFYKALALVAWTQEGKTPSEKLFDHFSGTEYPSPTLPDLTPLSDLKIHLTLQSNPAVLGLTYADIKQLDTIGIELVPERKGLILKYSEYLVSSRRFGTKVTRRYNDFLALYELLLARFPYRIVPRLPPKKIVSDSHFLEARRRGLQRWLTLVCRHPTICHDAVVSFFLTDYGSDIQYRIRDVFRRAPDEFMTSDLAGNAKSFVPSGSSEFATNREQVRSLVQIVSRLKQLADASVERGEACSRDAEDFSNQLKALGAVDTERFATSTWKHMQKGFSAISEKLLPLPIKASRHAIAEQVGVNERLALLLDVLIAHKDLCERLENGLAHDHQAALSKMLSLKKRKIQGVIRGTADSESVEQLQARMLAQENVITNIELRSDFSIYCVHMETQLVHAYLETLSSILQSLVTLRKKQHSEVADIWKQLAPTLEEYFNIDSTRTNGSKT